ncbi:MAG: AAA family ATPase, partial [Armatimonadota bacterium]
MEPIFLGTVAVGFLSEALSGIIGNRADDVFCRIVGTAIGRFFSRLLQKSDDALNWQNALHQAAIEATLDVVNECLQELSSPSLRERLPFTHTSPDETRNWLEEVRRQLTDELKGLREGTILTQISEEAQKRIETLLQPKGVLGSERVREFADQLTNLLLSDLSERFGEPSELFAQKVKEQPTWFDRFCAFSAKKLQQQPELKDFLNTQILAFVKDELEQLGEKVDKVLDVIHQWLSLLPDIDRRLQEIERLVEELKAEMRIIRKDVQEILRILRNWWGSNFVATRLKERTEKFLQDLTAQTFVGRKEPLKRLKDFISKNEKGIAIVYAPVGYGKTTLLANWLKEIRQRPEIAVVYHFFNRHSDLADYATKLEDAFAHLLGQIWAMTQTDGAPPFLPPNVDERRALLEETLARLRLGAHEKLILVLDGLDESEPILKHPPIPVNFPEGVFFVVSGRWDGEGEIPIYLRGWARYTEFIPLHALSIDELKEWLRKWGSGELKKFADDDEFVKLLHDKTGGFPLYVHYLLDELGNLAREGQDVRQALERKPRGFENYVREQVNQLASIVKSEEVARKMFALLTQAKGALREGELEQLGISAWDLIDLPHAVMRWFSVGEEDGERNFAFTHPLLAEEFGKVLGEEEGKKAREELISWCENWRKHKSHYALRYFAHHLHDDSSRWKQLFDLARDEDFA